MVGDLGRSPGRPTGYSKNPNPILYEVPWNITVLIQRLICYCQSLQYRQAGIVGVVAKLRFGRFQVRVRETICESVGDKLISNLAV